MRSTDLKTPSSANDHLESSSTENYWQHPLKLLKYTDGVKEAAEKFQCYWFLDVVVSWQVEIPRSEEFQVWKLERVEEDSYKVTCTDGNDRVLATQEIPFSDFPYDEFTVWVEFDVMLLPSEH